MNNALNLPLFQNVDHCLAAAEVDAFTACVKEQVYAVAFDASARVRCHSRTVNSAFAVG